MPNELPADYIEVESIGSIIRIDGLLNAYDDSLPELLSDFWHKMNSYGLNLTEVFIIPEYFKSGGSVALAETQVNFVDEYLNMLELAAGSFIIKTSDEASCLALYSMFSKHSTSSAMLFDSELRQIIARLNESNL